MTTTLPHRLAPAAPPCPTPRVRCLRGDTPRRSRPLPCSPEPPPTSARPDAGRSDPIPDGDVPGPHGDAVRHAAARREGTRSDAAPPSILRSGNMRPGAARGCTAAAEGAQARRAIATAMRTALEVLDGRRPATQLRPVFDASALRYWRAEGARAERASPSRLVRLRVELPGADAAEVAAVCTIDGRVRAVAARFERRHRAWCCASVRLI